MNKDYISDYSSQPDDIMQWLQKQTNLRTNHARMLCGAVEGKLLEFISGMIAPKHILEIGTFTGYSAISLARGLGEGGMLDAIELNDELEDLIREAFARAGVEKKINLIIGNAIEIIPKLNKVYDLVFIDANKREYVQYYNAVIEKVREGGYIIADNVLWNGKVETEAHDSQTLGIQSFNSIDAQDGRVENVILPLRDGINLIRIRKRRESYFMKASIKEIPLIQHLADVSFTATYKEILSAKQLSWMLNWMYSTESLRFQMEHNHTFFIMYCDKKLFKTAAPTAEPLHFVNRPICNPEAAIGIAAPENSGRKKRDDSAIEPDYLPCGYISIEREEKKLFHLQKIYLIPEVQGKGLGRTLIEYGLNFIRSFELKSCRVELNVNRKNKAVGFYKKMGFEITKSGDFEIGDGLYMNDYIMSMEINHYR